VKRKPHFEQVPVTSIRPSAIHDPVIPAPPRRQIRTKRGLRVPSSIKSAADKAVDDDAFVRHF
jgi:hypothetical protein